MARFLLFGGSGQVGALLTRALTARGHETEIVSRSAPAFACRHVVWDAKTRGPWSERLDEADVVVNLAGRNVNCRYTPENFAEMMSSRVDSTRVLGEAMASARRPPRVWLQMSTATIYAHRFDAPNDERTGIIGGQEADAPASWRGSIDIAQAWERTLMDAETPATRKVALRAAMIMSPDRGGIFDLLYQLTRLRLGGPVAGGRQFVSWIHEQDFVDALLHLVEDETLAGPVNLAAPHPLPQREFMAALRSAMGIRIGLPATAWMAAIGAWVMRSETELLLKSRRVVPGRLLESGFAFSHADWPAAARTLVERRRQAH